MVKIHQFYPLLSFLGWVSHTDIQYFAFHCKDNVDVPKHIASKRIGLHLMRTLATTLKPRTEHWTQNKRAHSKIQNHHPKKNQFFFSFSYLLVPFSLIFSLSLSHNSFSLPYQSSSSFSLSLSSKVGCCMH